MITVSIFINGNPILTRSAVNKGKCKEGCGKTAYQVDDGSTLCHDPKYGAVKLAQRMLDTIKESK